jgi:hypothetical protein
MAEINRNEEITFEYKFIKAGRFPMIVKGDSLDLKFTSSPKTGHFLTAYPEGDTYVSDPNSIKIDLKERQAGHFLRAAVKRRRKITLVVSFTAFMGFGYPAELQKTGVLVKWNKIFEDVQPFDTENSPGSPTALTTIFPGLNFHHNLRPSPGVQAAMSFFSHVVTCYCKKDGIAGAPYLEVDYGTGVTTNNQATNNGFGIPPEFWEASGTPIPLGSETLPIDSNGQRNGEWDYYCDVLVFFGSPSFPLTYGPSINMDIQIDINFTQNEINPSTYPPTEGGYGDLEGGGDPIVPAT